MTKEEFIKEIERTFATGVEIIKKKNSDYANSENPFKNFESASIIGLDVEQAILVRILDKLSRLGNCIKKELDNEEMAVKDETIEDTYLDAINYLAIAKAHRKSKKMPF